MNRKDIDGVETILWGTGRRITAYKKYFRGETIRRGSVQASSVYPS